MPATPKKATNPNLILAICCMSLLLVSMDVTIVNVALPSIQRDLHASLSQLQWVLDAYTLVIASLLMLSGSIADRFGRRRIFQTGLALFITGSVCCSLAPSIGALIACRALQGLGTSMLNPVALSIIANSFREPKARAQAVGIWGAVAGFSFAIGPMIGGLLTQSIGWRYIFWINLPLGIAAVILTAIFVPESKAPRARAFDPLGILLLSLTLSTFTYAVIEGPQHGWATPLIFTLFTITVLSFLAFLFHEPRVKSPLLDLRFFHSFPFSSATVIAVCSFGSFAAFLFLNALYLQQVRGLSAFHTGLCTLPLAITMMIAAPISGRIVGNHGPRRPLLLAGLSFFLCAITLTQLTQFTPLPLLITVYALFGIGLGMANPAISNSAVAGMPLSQAGVAGAVTSTGRQVGSAFGVAIAGTIVATHHAHGTDFTRATHPIWWIITLCATLIFLLGWLSNTAWARASVESVAHLLEEKAPA